MKNQTFGVEVEMILNREKAAKVIAEYLRGTIYHTYNRIYHTIEITAEDGRVWKITRDSSIHCNNDLDSCELVTPILKFEDIETLQEVIRKLRRAGAKVDESCGTHIHIGAERHTGKTLQNLINIFYSKDTLLYEALKVRSEGVNHYCKMFKTELIEEINKIKNPTIETVIDTWYETSNSYSARNRHYHSSRYHGLNLHSYSTIGTVEFRLFNATLHAGELKSFIHLALAINHQALTQKRATATKTSEVIKHTNHKYTFRCWLLRLKLNGPEFKNTRMHLLKNLEGNTVGNYRAV
jgi:hypothetical protein